MISGSEQRRKAAPPGDPPAAVARPRQCADLVAEQDVTGDQPRQVAGERPEIDVGTRRMPGRGAPLRGVAPGHDQRCPLGDDRGILRVPHLGERRNGAHRVEAAPQIGDIAVTEDHIHVRAVVTKAGSSRPESTRWAHQRRESANCSATAAGVPASAGSGM